MLTLWKELAIMDKLLADFKTFEASSEESSKMVGADEFQITVPIFNFTMNIIRECIDGTDCSYITYSDNGIGGIMESFTWDED